MFDILLDILLSCWSDSGYLEFFSRTDVLLQILGNKTDKTHGTSLSSLLSFYVYILATTGCQKVQFEPQSIWMASCFVRFLYILLGQGSTNVSFAIRFYKKKSGYKGTHLQKKSEESPTSKSGLIPLWYQPSCTHCSWLMAASVAVVYPAGQAVQAVEKHPQWETCIIWSISDRNSRTVMRFLQQTHLYQNQTTQ